MSQTWDATLRASGYRVTPQRQLVLEAVTRLHHASPEEICAEVNRTARGSGTARPATISRPRRSTRTWSAASAAG